ncbi:SHD1 domain-containing protein [Novipirellula sp.]|uniref:SHD1 domain-containing protein n=1 Tax=Novipirellula sp. TaxID=2795430 RepID=UPI003563113C
MAKTTVTAILFVVLLLATTETCIADEKLPPGRTQHKTPHGVLTVTLKSPIVYTLRGGHSNTTRFVTFTLNHDGETLRPDHDFFNVDGNPIKVTVTSIDNSIAIDDSPTIGGFYSFKKSGKTAFVVTLGETRIEVPVEIRELPYGQYDNVDAVIKADGFPTSKARHFVSWPDLETIDDIVYKPGPGNPASIEHWRYEKYPYAVIAIRGGSVADCSSIVVRESEPSAVDPMLMSMELTPEEKQADKARADGIDLLTKLIIAGVDVPTGTPTAKLKLMVTLLDMGRSPDPDGQMQNITDKSGKHSVRAIIVAAGDGEVVLLKEDCSKVTLPMNKLSDKDRRQVVDMIRERTRAERLGNR